MATNVTADQTITVANAGTWYFKSQAINNVGTGTFGTAVSIATPTVPDAPTLTLAINNPNTLPFDITATFVAPASDGGSALIDYDLQHSSDNVTFTEIAGGVSSDYTYTVTTAGTHYFQATVRNNVGDSVTGVVASIATPTVPTSDSSVTLSIDNPNPNPLDITVSFTVPSSDGGSSLVSYDLHSSPDDVTYTPVATGVTADQTVTVANAGTWYFKSLSTNNVGSSALGSAVSIATPTVPTVPTNLVLTSVSNTQIDAVWGAPTTDGGSSLVSYTISLETPAGSGNWNLIATVPPTQTSYQFTGLADDVEHQVGIFSSNNVGNNGNMAMTSEFTRPNAPVNFGVQTVDNETLYLGWNVNGLSTSTFTVQTNYSGTWTDVDTDTYANLCIGNSSGFCEYNAILLDSGSEYNFRIFNTNAGGASEFSTVAGNWTINDAPTGLVVTVDPDNSSESYLSWTAPSGTVVGYEIQRETPAGNGWSVHIADTGSTSTVHTDGSLTLSTYYNYRISAINLGGMSTTSNESSIITYTPPDPPTGTEFDLQEVSSNLRVQVSWIEPVDLQSGTLTGYMVERNDGTGWSIIGNTGTTPSLVDVDIQRGTTYEYRISAITNIATGQPSATNSLEFVEGVFSLPLTAVQGNTLESQSSFAKTSGDPVTYATNILIVKHDPDNFAVTTVASNTSLLTSSLSATINGNNVGIELTSGTIQLDTQFVYETSEYTYTGYLTTVQDGVTHVFQSADITVTPVNPYGGDTFANEFRDTVSYQTSTVELYAEPAGFDAVIRYQHQDPTIEPFFYAVENVQATHTNVSPVLDDKDFYVSVYVNPEEFDFVIDNPTTGLAHIECNENSPLTCPAWDAVYTPSGDVTHSLNPTHGAIEDIPDGIQSDFVTKSFKSPDSLQSFGLEPLGNLFGMPMVFIFVIGLGAVFTGRSAQMGVIFIAVTIGIMLYMGYISFDFGTSGISTAVTWGIIIVAMIGGILVGKRWS